MCYFSREIVLLCKRKKLAPTKAKNAQESSHTQEKNTINTYVYIYIYVHIFLSSRQTTNHFHHPT